VPHGCVGPCDRSSKGPQRIGSSDCLPKTQLHANPEGDVYGVTPARCRKVKGRGDEPRTEAPVNGGRNYNGQSRRGYHPEAVSKSGYLLEHPSISQYFRRRAAVTTWECGQSAGKAMFQPPSWTWNPQRPYARPPVDQAEEMVRPARRRAERGRTEMTTPRLQRVE